MRSLGGSIARRIRHGGAGEVPAPSISAEDLHDRGARHCCCRDFEAAGAGLLPASEQPAPCGSRKPTIARSRRTWAPARRPCRARRSNASRVVRSISPAMRHIDASGLRDDADCERGSRGPRADPRSPDGVRQCPGLPDRKRAAGSGRCCTGQCHARPGEATLTRHRRPQGGYVAAVELQRRPRPAGLEAPGVRALRRGARASPTAGGLAAVARRRVTTCSRTIRRPPLTASDRATFTGPRLLRLRPGGPRHRDGRDTCRPSRATSRAAVRRRSCSRGSARARFTLPGAEHELELFWLVGLRRRAVPAVPRRHQRRRDVRRRPLPPRHREGRRPRAWRATRWCWTSTSRITRRARYQPSWVCPLAPAANTLDVAVGPASGRADEPPRRRSRCRTAEVAAFLAEAARAGAWPRTAATAGRT